MKLKTVRAQNWKSFADTGDVELGDINLLVGRNNSGKSTFIQAVHQIQGGGGLDPTDPFRVTVGDSG